MDAWRRAHVDPAPDPNAAFRRMKRAEAYKRVDDSITNKIDDLPVLREITLKILDEEIDEWEDMDDGLDHDLWMEENDF